MTYPEAVTWVREHTDTDLLDQDDLEAAFAALYGRPADYQDRRDGLWSLCCAMAGEI